MDETKLRAMLLGEYNLEVGAGLGALAGKIIRVGLMGQSCNNRNVLFCLSALDAMLTQMRAEAPVASRAQARNP